MMHQQIIWWTTAAIAEKRQDYWHNLSSQFQINAKIIEDNVQPDAVPEENTFVLLELEQKSLLARLSTFSACIDGIVVHKQNDGDSIAMQSLIPVLVLRYVNAHCDAEIAKSIRQFSDFVCKMRIARATQCVMDKVSDELTYLGIEDKSPVIDSVSKVLASVM